MGLRILKDSEKFFELKIKAENLFAELVSSNFSNKSLQNQFEVCLKTMYEISNLQKAIYFVERIKTIQQKFNTLKYNKFQDKIEINRINALFGKISENQNSQFLNSILNNKLNEIASKNITVNTNQKSFELTFDKYYVLQFQSSIIIVPAGKRKIVKNIDYSTKYISLKNKKFPIFPLNPIILEDVTKSKLLLIRVIDGYKCVRFDSLIAEESIDELEFEERKIMTNSIYEDLKYFIRWRGRDCFYLDFSKKMYIEKFL